MDGRRTRRLVLASRSPARLRLLRNAGFAPLAVASDLDESRYDAGSTRELTAALAAAKARAVAATSTGPPALVLGCDSLLDLAGQTLGKPADAAEAVRRWRCMRETTGTLVTGHCLIDTTDGSEHAAIVETAVRFGDPTDAEIEAYVASGEPLEVAGAFTLDGLGGSFVDGIDGDWSNVVGLALPTFRRLLAAHGMGVHDLWLDANGSASSQ